MSSRLFRPRLALALVVLCLGAAAPARAGPAPLWLCGLSAGATRLVCVAEPDPVSEEEAAPAAAAPAATQVRGASFPLDPQRRYSVNLLGPATDMEMVAQLAQATMCLRSPGCRAILRPGVSRFDEDEAPGSFATGAPPGRSAALGAWR